MRKWRVDPEKFHKRRRRVREKKVQADNNLRKEFHLGDGNEEKVLTTLKLKK